MTSIHKNYLPWVHSKSVRQSSHKKNDKVVWLIGAAKIVYGLLLLGVGIGAFHLIGKNLTTELWRLTERWNIDFHNQYVRMLFQQTEEISPQKLFLLTVLTFAYAALFFVEGAGLILGKYWAQWLVVIDTGSFIPSEIYYLIRDFNWFDAILLPINVACVVYLVWRIKNRDREPRKSRPAQARKSFFAGPTRAS